MTLLEALRIFFLERRIARQRALFSDETWKETFWIVDQREKLRPAVNRERHSQPAGAGGPHPQEHPAPPKTGS